jgi:hypothetical protein
MRKFALRYLMPKIKRLLGMQTADGGQRINWKDRQWSIGIYKGSKPYRMKPAAGIVNPVLTSRDVSDVPADLIADPFMLQVDRVWYMFFEVLDWHNNRGGIGLAQSSDGVNWNYQRVVLSEPFHLSYPYVFQWQGHYYMIPESYQARAVRLYRAERFPDKWEYLTSLLDDGDFIDNSIFRFADKWWLYTCTKRNDSELCLYWANTLTGPWHAHKQNPIIIDNSRIARPGGRVVIANGNPIRFSQNSDPFYGRDVRAFKVTKLTPSVYKERAARMGRVIASTGVGWNRYGMHHIDPHQLDDGSWLACVDGWTGIDNRRR